MGREVVSIRHGGARNFLVDFSKGTTVAFVDASHTPTCRSPVSREANPHATARLPSLKRRVQWPCFQHEERTNISPSSFKTVYSVGEVLEGRSFVSGDLLYTAPPLPPRAPLQSGYGTNSTSYSTEYELLGIGPSRVHRSSSYCIADTILRACRPGLVCTQPWPTQACAECYAQKQRTAKLPICFSRRHHTRTISTGIIAKIMGVESLTQAGEWAIQRFIRPQDPNP